MGLSQTFIIGPTGTGSPTNAAAIDTLLVNDLGSVGVVASSMWLGEQTEPKTSGPNYGIYLKAEPTLPDNAIIEAVRLKLYLRFAAEGVVLYKVWGGLLKRDGIWDDADGLYGYPNRTAIPPARVRQSPEAANPNPAKRVLPRRCD